jgi:hypothetical protein
MNFLCSRAKCFTVYFDFFNSTRPFIRIQRNRNECDNRIEDCRLSVLQTNCERTQGDRKTVSSTQVQMCFLLRGMIRKAQLLYLHKQRMTNSGYPFK